VEIDSTFYGIPRKSSVSRWREQSADDFKICPKMPRSITHDSGLVNFEVELAEFLNTVSVLEDKLGVILIQFPASFDRSNQAEFKKFLAELPTGYPYTVEFRHPSWYRVETAEMLSAHGVCWAASEYPGVPKTVEITVEMIFVRFVGEHGRFRAHDREQIDVTPKLSRWWRWIRPHADSVHSVYVFFNDDFSGHAPASANRFKEIIGLQVIKPDVPRQMRFL
jgi:uncharacterized protein YecE (DUF72 family)